MSNDGRLGAGDIILAFLAGAAAGAVAAVLLAPASGRETREFLSERAKEGQDRANEMARQGREVLNRQRENIVSAIDRGKEAYMQALSEKDQA
jgi:gas vesicle protein